MKRRSILLCAAALPLAACGAITVSGTISLAKLSAYAAAVQSGVATALGLPGVATLLPAGVGPLITTAAAAMVAAAASLAASSGGAQTLSFDTSSLPAALVAFEGDASTILGDLGVAFGAAAASVTSTGQTILAALKTVLLLAEIVAAPAGTVGAVQTPMSESQALAVLLSGKG